MRLPLGAIEKSGERRSRVNRERSSNALELQGSLRKEEGP